MRHAVHEPKCPEHIGAVGPYGAVCRRTARQECTPCCLQTRIGACGRLRDIDDVPPVVVRVVEHVLSNLLPRTASDTCSYKSSDQCTTQEGAKTGGTA
jgi:hypothetical protein